jgi:3-hydroxyisobutyrate dehydrogenase-like beta-hydroxyacid dehydrogenase
MMEQQNPKKMALCGLGAMGLGMATHLCKANWPVVGWDISESSRLRFETLGGVAGTSAVDASRESEFIISMVADPDQTNTLLFGERDDGGVAYGEC